MRTVHKFPVTTVVPISLPPDARVLHFAEQGGRLCAWVELDTAQRTVPRMFQVVGTGHQLHRNAVYCGTCQQGPFVWHLYELVDGGIAP